MDKFWSEALKATGPVAVIGFLLWYALQQFFNDQILQIFDSQQVFIILLVVLGALFIILYACVRWHFQKAKITPSPKSPTVANIRETTIGGDFVMGDKIEKRDNGK